MIISFGEILNIGIKRLEQAGIPDARRDAELLLLYLMNETRNFLFIHRNDATDEAHADQYFEMVDRRAEGMPLQYITGSQEFMGLDFKVNESVLIPRQDTETVVEFAIEKAKSMKKCKNILDMCCGSGAIAVSVAKFMKDAAVTACDCSSDALAVAAGNAVANGVDGRIKFMKTDMFMVEKRGKQAPLKKKFNMIISNPPYIPSEVIETLQVEVKDHEPRLALDGGGDGLDFYRILAEQSAEHLKKGGILVMEIGAEQAETVSALLEETGFYEDVQIHKDLAGRDRIAYCRLAM